MKLNEETSLILLSIAALCLGHCVSDSPEPTAAPPPAKILGQHPVSYSTFDITSVRINGVESAYRQARATDRAFAPAIQGEDQYIISVADEPFLFFPTAHLEGNLLYVEISVQRDESNLEVRSGTVVRENGAEVEHPVEASPLDARNVRTSTPLLLSNYGGFEAEFAAQGSQKRLHRFHFLLSKNGKPFQLIIEAYRKDVERREWPAIRQP